MEQCIVANAMLAAFLDKNNNDIMDLMKPFVLYLFPEQGQKLEVSKIAEGIREEFGFEDVPENVVLKIIGRIKKEHEYIERKKGNFYVIKTYDKDRFEQKREIIKGKIENLSQKLAEFIVNEGYKAKVSKEEAQEYIQRFLETYNYIGNDIIKYKEITTTSSSQVSNFWVARFVDDQHTNNTDAFNDFFELIKGSLAARSFMFSIADNPSGNGNLNNTSFYFDTRLLLNCLGLGSEEEHQATTELKELIEDNGGEVKTFEHYVDELHGILTKYIKDPDSREGLSLDYFRREKVEDIFVEAYQNSLEDKLKDINIIVTGKPDANSSIEKLDWPIDYMQLKSALTKSVNYSNEDALNNDLQTLESISIIRDGLRGKQTIENCRALFVTQNKDLTYATHQYFKQEQEKRGISLAVNEIELTAWLWVTYGKNSNTLPKLRLLENVYTACCPSEEVLEAFKKNIDYLCAEKQISDAEAAYFRHSRMDISTLVDKISNDSNKVNKERVLDFVDDYKKKIRREEKKNFEKQYHQLDLDKKKFEDGYSQKEKDYEERMHLLELREKRNDSRIQKQESKRREKLIKKAEAYAKRQEKIVRYIVRIMLGFITAMLMGKCILEYAQNNKCLISVYGGLSVLGCLLLAISFYKRGAVILKLFGKKVYAWSYDKKIKEYLDDEDISA